MRNGDILEKAFIMAENEMNIDCLLDIDEMEDVLVSEVIRERILSSLQILNLKRNQSSRGLLKALLIAAIVILAATLTAFAVKPLRNIVIEKFVDGSRIIFIQEKGDDTLYPKYEYIPDGYVLTNELKDKNSQQLTYSYNGYDIYIDTFINKNSVSYFDTENAETGEIEIGSSFGYYSVSKDSVILVWSTGKYNHTIVARKNTVIDGIEIVADIARSQSW